MFLFYQVKEGKREKEGGERMRKKLILLVAIISLSLVACGKKSDNPAATTPENSSSIQATHVVKGSVQSIVGTDVSLINIESMRGNNEAIGDAVTFHLGDLDGDAVKNIQEGDVLEIFYDGRLTKSIPPQGNAASFKIVSSVDGK